MSLYVGLFWEDIALLFPREELSSVESVLDIVSESAAPPVSGWLQAREQHWPTYSLDRQLQPQTELPRERRICALFTQAGFALTCTSVVSLETPLTAEPLPGCLRLPHSPLLGLARWNSRIALVTSSARIAAYLQPPDAA